MPKPDANHDETAPASRFGAVLEYSLGTLSILLLAGLAILTCVDVIARYYFNSPVNGAFELTQMMLFALIFAALPLTTARNEHVDVELVTAIAGDRIDRIFRALGNLVSAAVLFALAWRLWAHGMQLADEGAVTNSLELPLAPLGILAAFSCGLSGIAAFMNFAQDIGAGGKRQ